MNEININSIFRYLGSEFFLFLRNYFLAFIFFHNLLQVICVKIRAQDIKPYLLINIRRKTIASYLIIRQSLNLTNIIFIYIGFILVIKYFHTLSFESLFFILGILSLIIINNFFALHIKITALDYFLVKPIVIAILCLFIFFFFSQIGFFMPVSTILFDMFLDNALYISVFNTLIIFLLFLNSTRLILKKIKCDESM